MREGLLWSQIIENLILYNFCFIQSGSKWPPWGCRGQKRPTDFKNEQIWPQKPNLRPQFSSKKVNHSLKLSKIKFSTTFVLCKEALSGLPEAVEAKKGQKIWKVSKSVPKSDLRTQFTPKVLDRFCWDRSQKKAETLRIPKMVLFLFLRQV